MVVSHKIKDYSTLIISNYSGGKQVGFLYLYDPNNKYLGYFGIIKDGQALPQNVQHANNILNIYFHEAEMETLIDTLRNEDPVYVKFHTTLKWGSLSTGKEPVGEGEDTP
ncbi:hypothetical protein [uncultured Aquimarina sp.]|uniref:hypothetical protein n=1 Tax=uncultured Aquimarina sp. TaxID=575652 RepID=UPI002630C74E|nr:hypothetical protein [uncultured Aquimarina sp.]